MPAAALRPFKVAIVGGGMTGLTAALHLDRLGIDFVLLEAYNDITPEVGASLALYPNFQRILDQLGVLDDVRNESAELVRLVCRGVEGKVMFKHEVADDLHWGSNGYGIATFTRSQLLKILYRNISEQGKKKIFTGKRVSGIEELPGDDGVRVHVDATDDSPMAGFYDVDVVIGADGINSVVRSEMWRLAEENDPRAFASDKAEDLTTEFACVFGLSHKTGDLEKDKAYQVSGQDMTIGVFGGPNGEACWFVFFAVPKTQGRDCMPRWSTEDTQGLEICEKYSSCKLSDNTTFGDVFANAHRTTTQACPKHCLRRWHYNRIICLGDAVAKANPILAQGGAQGAESVVMLIDRLYNALQKWEDDEQTEEQRRARDVSSLEEDRPLSKVHFINKPSMSEIVQILAQVSAERQPRVKAAVDNSQQICQVSTWSGWLFWFVGKYITPLLPTWVIVAQALGPWKGAYVSTSLPKPTTKYLPSSSV